MGNKDLLLKLVKADCEEDVDAIIDEHPVLSKDKNWKPYGGTRSNFGNIHNQQVNAIPALVEKPINSIDAILVKECRQRGIDPESPKAPATLQEAVEKFLSIPQSDFSEISAAKRREIAKNVQIIAEGSRRNPNIIIYDNGEGQHPSDFENTFVSLIRENKIKIKFVQGIYNMGGSGILPFCGRRKYQLILSRKHPRLLNGKPDLYGFTLVRLHKATQEYKQSWYEFCVDENGEIFSFRSDKLDLGLFETQFYFGTYIKLFNYDLPDRSDITLGLWRALNRYLYYSALPILLYEKRDYKGHSPTKIMLGNRMRVMIDDREMKETSLPISINFSGAKCPGEITVFKDDVDKNEFIEKLAVIFTVNGQVHGYLGNAFITSSAQLPYLSGSLLVNIDCTSMPVATRVELIMASRDRMRENEVFLTLKEKIAKELKDLDLLRKINNRRRDEKIFQNPKDEEFLRKVMSKLLAQNEEVSKLLGLDGNIISNISKTIQRKTREIGTSFKSKRYPTFVRFKKIAPGNIKMLPQNGECKLFLETDVEDEYLLRSKDKGELKIRFEKPHFGVGPRTSGNGNSDEEVFDVNVVGPSQGEIKVRIKAKDNLPVGTTVPVNIELTSPEGPHIVTAYIRIDNPIEKAKEKESETRTTYSLPELREVYREKKQGKETPIWGDKDYIWCGEDICKIFPSSEERCLVDAVAINMDADVVHNYIRRRKLTDKNIEHLQRLYKVGIYLVSLGLFLQLSQREDIEEKEELLSNLMKGIGKVIIPVVINEEIIKEVEKEEKYDVT